MNEPARRSGRRRILPALAALVTALAMPVALRASPALEGGFHTPPDSARLGFLDLDQRQCHSTASRQADVATPALEPVRVFCSTASPQAAIGSPALAPGGA